mgnify:CR=1 FL=1
MYIYIYYFLLAPWIDLRSHSENIGSISLARLLIVVIIHFQTNCVLLRNESRIPGNEQTINNQFVFFLFCFSREVKKRNCSHYLTKKKASRLFKNLLSFSFSFLFSGACLIKLIYFAMLILDNIFFLRISAIKKANYAQTFFSFSVITLTTCHG